MRTFLFIAVTLGLAAMYLANRVEKVDVARAEPAVMPAAKLTPATPTFLAINTATAEEAKAPPLPTGTHEVTKAIEVKSDTKGLKLQTLCAGGDGMVYALLGSGRYGDNIPTGEVQVFDGAGEKIRNWKVNFSGQAINCSPDGSLVVAGDGKIAIYDAQGHVKTETDLPFIKTLAGDVDKILKKAEERREAEIQSYEEHVKEFKASIEEISKKDEDKRSDDEKMQLSRAQSMAGLYENMLAKAKKKVAKDYVEEITGRLKMINAVAATDKDIYVVCGELKGYGFAVWRMDWKLEDSKQVLSGLRGCCGQMDVQCCDDDLIVAQNGEHNVGRYDRDGKKISKFGRRAGRDGSADGFGGCCNPMNVRAGAGGRVYTAESEGIVRSFDKDGKPEGVVGSVKISGGCKNVAIAASADGNTVWFCDQPGSKIHVLVRKSKTAVVVNAKD